MRKSTRNTRSTTPKTPVLLLNRLSRGRQLRSATKSPATPLATTTTTPGGTRRSARNQSSSVNDKIKASSLALEESSEESPSPPKKAKVQTRGVRNGNKKEEKMTSRKVDPANVEELLDAISSDDEDDNDDDSEESGSGDDDCDASEKEEAKVVQKKRAPVTQTRSVRPRNQKSEPSTGQKSSGSTSKGTSVRKSRRQTIAPDRLSPHDLKAKSYAFVNVTPLSAGDLKLKFKRVNKSGNFEDVELNSKKPTRATRGKRKSDEEEGTQTEESIPVRRTRGKSVSAAATVETPSTPRSSRRKAVEKEKVEAEATPKTRAKVAAPKKGGKGKETSTPVPSTSAGAALSNGTQGTQLEWKFNIYGIPKCPLPCRESQFEDIWKFIFENVTEQNSGCMYVSGVPGTGKTVIVQAVIDTMQKHCSEKKKDLEFKHLYINGLTLSSPDKIWKRMFKGLQLHSKSSGVSSKEALKRLNSYFEGQKRIPVVLVVDELDQILDKQQSILYQLLEWSSHAQNMFSFVAIFNTMSLPEQGLAMRNYSRMGFKRAVFPPYSYEELQTIVLNMLSTFKTSKLNPECVSLLSRKVAAISGDARRALEIARRTLEIAESGNFSGIQAVSQAFKEIFSSAKIETIKHTSFLEQMVLKTICDEIKCSGIEEVLIAKIYNDVIPKAVYEGVQYKKDDILKALMRLAIMRLVIVEDNKPSLHKRLLLKVPVEDVNFALGCHSDLKHD